MKDGSGSAKRETTSILSADTGKIPCADNFYEVRGGRLPDAVTPRPAPDLTDGTYANSSLGKIGQLTEVSKGAVVSNL